MRATVRPLLLAVGLSWLSGCNCAQLPDAVFACEADRSCAQPGFVCGGDGLCRRPVPDAGVGDAGADAGVEDAGFDAGVEDAGVEDAGFDAGVEDAGVEDAGFDAGVEDAGVEDAGFDAGVEDAGVEDAGFDAGVEDAGVEDAGFDAGCMPTGAVDEPDPLGLDVNCDGFDGDLSRAAFIDETGDDVNDGSRAAPVRTFTRALALGKEQLFVTNGTHAGDVTLGVAVAVYGGYDRNGWVKTTTKSVLQGAVIAEPVDAGRIVLEWLDVRAPAATTPGSASIAVTLRHVASTSRVVDCRFQAGAGANGGDGLQGEPAAPGSPGGVGLDGVSGADGGLGGAEVDCGDAGFAPAGFAGGGSLTSGFGANGEDAVVGGAGAAPEFCDGGPCAGFDGGAGLDGMNGLTSSARPADPTDGFGTLTASNWVAPLLFTWAPAQHGRPGGGGGAGGGLLDLSSTLLAVGGGAGGGGSGGCGGRSGTAGQSGGASIALALVDASPQLLRVQLETSTSGRGGNGGAGTAGGSGGVGGVGALGQIIATGSAGSGANGGRGGAGGAGRQGPGGWGGAVVGVFCAGTSAPSLDGTTTWTSSTRGVGGSGDPSGRAGAAPATGISVNCP